MEKVNPSLICIIGVDGTGKTTHANMLVNFFKKNGIPCRYVWFRFFHFLSLPLLAYCRLFGLTIYEANNGEKIGRHEFYKSKTISILYPYVLFIDMLPAYLFKIILPLNLGSVIICDRFIFDTLVDLMINLNNFSINKTIIGRLYLMLVPKNTKVVLLDLNESIIRKRRTDLARDQSLEARRIAYHQLAKDLNVPTIVNDGMIDDVNNRIFRLLGMD
jgi:thymidylate kinase